MKTAPIVKQVFAMFVSGVRILCARYVPLDSPQSHQQTIDKEWSSLCILCFEIEQMSGKQAVELCQ